MTMLIGLAMVIGATAASAAVGWQGNGYSDGECDTYKDTPLNPGPGERSWHFVLNQTVDSETPYRLYFAGGNTYVAGTSVGNGSTWHFYVITDSDADPTGSVVDAPEGKLVISHCEDGVSGGNTTTTSTPTTKPPAPTTTPSTAPPTTSPSTTSPSTTSTTEEPENTVPSTSTTSEPSSTTEPSPEPMGPSTTAVEILPTSTTELVALPNTGSSHTGALALIGVALMLIGFCLRRAAV